METDRLNEFRLCRYEVLPAGRISEACLQGLSLSLKRGGMWNLFLKALHWCPSHCSEYLVSIELILGQLG